MARRGNVTFDQERCKGCGLCISVCPVNILAFDIGITNKRGYVPSSIQEPEKCISCMNCALMCPDLVITVERIDEGVKA